MFYPIPYYLEIPLLSLSQIVLCYFFPGFLGYQKRKNVIPFFTVSTVVFASVLCILFIYKGTPEQLSELTDTVMVLYMLSCFYLLYKPERKITFFFIALALSALIDYLVALILSFFVHLGELDTIFISATLYTLLIIIVLIIQKMGIRPVPEIIEGSPLVYITIFFVAFNGYYSIFLNLDEDSSEQVSNVLRIITAVMVTVCISNIAYKYVNLQRSRKQAEEQLEIELRHYEEMIQKNRDVRSFRHDIKNNLMSMNALADSERYDELKSYIDDLSDTLESSSITFSTGNYLADAILSDKSALAKKNGTVLTFDGTIPAQGIKNSDLCTILANSLDNAIRACEGVNDAVISVKSIENKSGAVITISNPTSENVVIKGNNIKTTKSDKSNHGLGIANIRRTAQKYNGYADISYSNNVFTIEIGLVLKTI
jgi:sensor histidine kinase YesM